MQGFSQLLSTFGDAAKPLVLPLEPRLKVGHDAATAPPSPPGSFDTLVGERRVPRERNPKKPSYEMIQRARWGDLSGWLRSGIIFRASDLVGMVNPKTAVITLDDIYDFETRFLTPLSNEPIAPPPMSSVISFKKTADKGADDGKTLRNLFFVSSNQDELPSFHFWTKAGEIDPVEAGRESNWGKYLDQNSLSTATIAKTAVSENERTAEVRYEAEGQHPIQGKQPLLREEPTEGRPSSHTDGIHETNASPVSAQAPVEAEVLLHFNRGGMYLREFTHRALYAMACWLVKNEEEEEDEDKGEEEEDGEDNGPPEPRDIFLDILEEGKELREEKIVSVSPASSRYFQEKIKPVLGRPNTKYRIRSTRYQSSWNLNSGFDSGGVGDMKYDLKLVRPNVGFCYCSAGWQVFATFDVNVVSFEKAITFLFDWELSAHPKSNRLSLDIPQHGSFDLDRDAPSIIDAKVQKIFAELSKTPAKADSRPAEIFIRDVVEDDTDASDLGTGQHNERNPGAATGTRGLITHEIAKLQERLKIAEAYMIENDELQKELRDTKSELSEMDGLKKRLSISEARARLPPSCPFCNQSWVGLPNEERKNHLKLHQRDIVHQPAEQKCPKPDCTTWLGENQIDSTYEAISGHLRGHIEEEHAEDGVCEYQGCHTNMYALTADQHEEHESAHRDNRNVRERLLKQIRNLEETLEKQSRMQEQVESLEDTVKARELQCNRLQQQLEALQDAANERDQFRNDVVHITEERNSLQKRAAEMESRLKAAPGLDQSTQTKEAEPETKLDDNSKHPNPTEASRILYCDACLKSVDKLSADAKIKHAEKCKTGVSEYSLFTPAEAKAEREKRNKSRDDVAPPAQERTDDEVRLPDTKKRGKQKTSAEAAPPKSQQDEAEDANAKDQSEARKPTSRKTLKRKNDTFKPSKEDESDDEEPEPPKKKSKLKAKAASKDTEPAHTRRSTRSQDVYHPPKEEDEEDQTEEEEEEAHDEPSSSARGKRKRKAAAVSSVSKKVKTKK